MLLLKRLVRLLLPGGAKRKSLKGTGEIPGGKWFLEPDGSLYYLDWWNVPPSFECVGGDTREDPIILGCS